MIKLNTIEGRTIYVNSNFIASIEVAETIVHLQVGNQWYKIKESEDEIVEKLLKSEAPARMSSRNEYERF